MDSGYCKRFRMDIDLPRSRVPLASLPFGYQLVPWNEALLDVHARTKYQAFRQDVPDLCCVAIARPPEEVLLHVIVVEGDRTRRLCQGLHQRLPRRKGREQVRRSDTNLNHLQIKKGLHLPPLRGGIIPSKTSEPTVQLWAHL